MTVQEANVRQLFLADERYKNERVVLVRQVRCDGFPEYTEIRTARGGGIYSPALPDKAVLQDHVHTGGG